MSLFLCEIKPLFRMKCVDKDKARDLARIRAREGAHDQPAEGMTDEDIGRRNAGPLE
jgi:hypothetical protein